MTASPGNFQAALERLSTLGEASQVVQVVDAGWQVHDRRASAESSDKLSASEAAQKFTCGEVTHWLRPDGAGDIYWQGEVRRFYLEWDRGTVKLPDLVEKCRLYAAYYAFLARKQVDDRSLPDVLAVTTSPVRENVIRRVLDSALEEVSRPQAHFLTSLATLIHRLGPFGVVWHGADSSARRQWP